MKNVDRIIKPKLKEQETQISLLTKEYHRVSSEFERFKDLVYYSIGVPPVTDEQLKMRKDMEGFLPKLTEEEIKWIFSHESPGRPHLRQVLVDRGFCEFDQAFPLLLSSSAPDSSKILVPRTKPGVDVAVYKAQYLVEIFYRWERK